MKVSLDVDCTPEEARRFLGLPDLTPVHDIYIDKMKTALGDGFSADTAQRMLQGWAPMNEAGMDIWRQFLGQLDGGAGQGAAPKK